MAAPFQSLSIGWRYFVAHLASSVYYGTRKSYLYAVRSLQIDLGYGDPLVATPRLDIIRARSARHPSCPIAEEPILPPRFAVTDSHVLEPR